MSKHFFIDMKYLNSKNIPGVGVWVDGAREGAVWIAVLLRVVSLVTEAVGQVVVVGL